MKTKKLMDTTGSRYEYNRLRKEYLTNRKIKCSWCGYHRGENKEGKWYGGFLDSHIRYPNWKLVSKNKKQWMKKSLKIKKELCRWNRHSYIDILF